MKFHKIFASFFINDFSFLLSLFYTEKFHCGPEIKYIDNVTVRQCARDFITYSEKNGIMQ